MEIFTKLFGSLLVFVYHCFDRIVINGYLENLSRPELVVHFFHFRIGMLTNRLAAPSTCLVAEPVKVGAYLPGASPPPRHELQIPNPLPFPMMLVQRLVMLANSS